MEVLVGLGIVAFFIVLGLNRSQKIDEKMAIVNSK